MVIDEPPSRTLAVVNLHTRKSGKFRDRDRHRQQDPARLGVGAS
jgi:hypothetical protein